MKRNWLMPKIGLLLAALALQVEALSLVEPHGLPERVSQLLYVEEARAGFYNPAVVAHIYQANNFQPLWFRAGRLTAVGKAALDALQNTAPLGLAGDDYQHALFVSPPDGPLPPAEAREAELLMTDRLLLLAQHIKHGRILPDSLQPNNALGPLVIKGFHELVASDQLEQQLHAWLASLTPKQRAYQFLAKELERLEGLPKQTLGLHKTLKLNDQGAEIARLRQLLIEFGYLKSAGVITDPEIFDLTLQQAVIAFQLAHSLEADGIAGSDTRTALERLLNGDRQMILVNMERWRWMPENFGSDYIAVNIANFDLNYFYEGKLALTMKTIVGKNYRKTPVFTKDMRYFVVNPTWNVPHMIASKDLLPKIQKDVNYLTEMNMLVWQGWGEQQVRIDPLNVDWQKLTAKTFPYRLQQMPGPKNALGQVKFMFPNEHNVYLHDTNDRALFAKSQRTFSSGCIRLEKPLVLLELIAKNHAGLDSQATQQFIDSGQEKTVLLKQPLPVHIQYWTTWVDAEGRVHYRHDIYARDQAIWQALQAAI